jgi:hypothetical protein
MYMLERTGIEDGGEAEVEELGGLGALEGVAMEAVWLCL